VTSEDEANEDRDQKMGKLSEEMVMTMNFGGGSKRTTVNKDPEDKTRKEIFEEIIAKSKAYKAAKFEVKEAAKELTDRLDKQFFDILPLLNMSKVKTSTTEESGIDAYEQIAAKLKEQARAQPSHVVMGEREQARMRKTKLQALA
jgi:nucleolar protein 14